MCMITGGSSTGQLIALPVIAPSLMEMGLPKTLSLCIGELYLEFPDKLLTAIIVRCVIVGVQSGNTMSALVCFSVAAFMTFQTFVNIGMCIGITPVIGITLPFFSYGGSSLLATFAAMGMVSGVHYRPKKRRSSIYY